MRVLKLTLERYGCFTDKELHFRPGASLHLVYGENEAGKSTALAAITDLLFGIESRTVYDYQYPGQLSLGGTIRGGDGKDFSFKRRKGTKITLLDVDSKPIAEDSLAPYLHALTRSVFCSAFGMNSESLRAGATEMLKVSGDSGVSLFAAASGVRGLVEMQKRLEERSEQIFTPRRAGNRTFYQALDRLSVAKDELRRLELKDRDLRELRQGIQEANDKLQGLRARRTSIVAEREQLNRNKDIAPLLRLIASDESELTASTELPVWDRNQIRSLREAEARVEERERLFREREDGEAELRSRRDGYSLDANLLAQADEIEQLFGLTGNYVSQTKDLPRVRDELRGYTHDLSNVARRLGVQDVDMLAPLQPTDSLIARIRKLAQSGRELHADIEERNRAIVQVDEELRKLKQQQALDSPGLEASLRRQTLESLRPAFNRLPEFQHLSVAVLGAERGLVESASQASPPITDLDALSVTSLPVMTTINNFIAGVDDDNAASLALASQEKSALESIAKIKRRISAITRGAALGSPEQIVTARQVRESLWLPLRSVLLQTRPDPTPNEIAEEVIGYERSTINADRLADSAVTDAEQVAEYATLSTQLVESEALLDTVRGQVELLRTSISKRTDDWARLWEQRGLEMGTPREMSQWLTTALGLLKNRSDLRNKQLEMDDLRRFIDNARPALDELGRMLRVPDVESLSHELAFSAIDKALRTLEETEIASARVQTLVMNAQNRRESAQASRDALDGKLSDWQKGWQEAMNDFHSLNEMTVDETEAALSAWAEYPQLLKERKTRQRRVDGIERDIRTFEDRVTTLLTVLARKDDQQTSRDGAIRLLNKELKSVRASEVALTQVNSQLAGCVIQKEIAERALNQARSAFELQCAGLPPGKAPSEQIELLEARREVFQRVRQHREALAALSRGESEGKLREMLDDFAEDEAPGRLNALGEEEQHLTDETNETYAKWKTLTGRFDSLTKGVGAEIAGQRCKNAEAELIQKAREWAVYRFGQLLLSRAIDEHRTQNQNPLMRRAGKLFRLLTEDSFIGIEEELDEKDNPRLVGRRDAKRTVCIDGMSKGTRDQLYLSLRLAYLEEYASQVESVPFIGDDLLVSSDEKRTTRGLQVLAATSLQIQPILFTHHLRVLEIAKSALGETLDLVDLRNA